MTHADDKELTLLLRGGLSESEKQKSWSTSPNATSAPTVWPA